MLKNFLCGNTIIAGAVYLKWIAKSTYFIRKLTMEIAILKINNKILKT